MGAELLSFSPPHAQGTAALRNETANHNRIGSPPARPTNLVAAEAEAEAAFARTEEGGEAGEDATEIFLFPVFSSRLKRPLGAAGEPLKGRGGGGGRVKVLNAGE